MRICIVGGSGFIGTSLAKLINLSNIDFYIVDKVLSDSYPLVTRKADVRSFSELSNAIDRDTDLIILLAAEHRDDVVPKTLYTDVNVNGAINISKVAKLKGISKIIFTSSVAIYGLGTADIGEGAAAKPFNEYGASKLQAENKLALWQREEPESRTLVIVRPTVVFGPGNRGNVYNLFRQLSKKYFIMIGDGENKKSIAYVENISAFLFFVRLFRPGLYIYNYVDKPDLTMNNLIHIVRKKLNLNSSINLRLPYFIGLLLGRFFDILSLIPWLKPFPISEIRVKKFCANSTYSTSVNESGFIPSIELVAALEKTLHIEFVAPTIER